MIKDILVRLEGDDADAGKLAAAAEIAHLFGGHITGIFLNALPAIVPEFGEASEEAHVLAKEAGNAIENRLSTELAELGAPAEVRRFDVFSDEIVNVLARQSRAADVFLSEAPNSGAELRDTVENLLFQSPRHLMLVPKTGWSKSATSRIVIGWNDSREAARAVAEALPYLHKAQTVTIVAVVDSMPVEEDAVAGRDLKRHLRHHGVHAILHHLVRREGSIADNLLREAQRREAGLIVIGGYHHSPIRERLIGGVTKSLLDYCPLPLLIAH
jgi:nucleotide-binding universal stress UspA family protein